MEITRQFMARDKYHPGFPFGILMKQLKRRDCVPPQTWDQCEGPIIVSGSQVIISGKIVHITRVNMIISTNGMTPFIISDMASPSPGGAVPFKTKIDIAMGGVWNAICRLMQIIIPAHRGLNPSLARIGEKIVLKNDINPEIKDISLIPLSALYPAIVLVYVSLLNIGA